MFTTVSLAAYVSRGTFPARGGALLATGYLGSFAFLTVSGLRVFSGSTGGSGSVFKDKLLL